MSETISGTYKGQSITAAIMTYLGLSAADVANMSDAEAAATIEKAKAAIDERIAEDAAATKTSVQKTAGASSSTTSYKLAGKDHLLDARHSTPSQTSSTSAASNINLGRLTEFTYQDTSTGTSSTSTSDPQMDYRCYFMLDGQTSLLQEIARRYSDTQTILDNLAGKYTAFLLTGMQIHLQEKQQIMQTVGDNYAATFAGKEPQVLSLSGLLPWDYNKADLTASQSSTGAYSGSWMIDMLNAYTLYFRASVLARAKCWLKIVLPGLRIFRCYPVTFYADIGANSDHLVPFSMQAYVVEDTSTIYGVPAASKTAATKTTEAQQAGTTRTPTEAIEKQTTDSKQSDLEKTLNNVNDWINSSTKKYTDWTNTSTGRTFTTVLTTANALSKTAGLSTLSKVTTVAAQLRKLAGTRTKTSTK